MADAVGCDPSFISMIINGTRRPSLETAIKLAEITETHPLHWLDRRSFGPDGLPIQANDEANDG